MKELKLVADVLGFNVSPSSLNTFAYCPYQWKIVYLNGVRGPDNLFAAAGSTFHKIFEVASKNYDKNLFLKERATHVYNLCMAVPPGEWKQLMSPILKMYAIAENKRFERILKFVDDEDEAWDYFNPIENERKYVLDDEGITFIADRQVMVPAGYAGNREEVMGVIDFKPKGDEYSTTLNRQLTAMAIHLKDDSGNTPVVGAYFYRTGVELPMKKVHHASVRGIKNIAEKMLNCLKWGRFKKNLGWGCAWCSFQLVCRAKIPLETFLENKRNRNEVVGGIFDNVNHKNTSI